MELGATEGCCMGIWLGDPDDLNEELLEGCQEGLFVARMYSSCDEGLLVGLVEDCSEGAADEDCRNEEEGAEEGLYIIASSPSPPKVIPSSVTFSVITSQDDIVSLLIEA